MFTLVGLTRGSLEFTWRYDFWCRARTINLRYVLRVARTHIVLSRLIYCYTDSELCGIDLKVADAKILLFGARHLCWCLFNHVNILRSGLHCGAAVVNTLQLHNEQSSETYLFNPMKWYCSHFAVFLKL